MSVQFKKSLFLFFMFFLTLNFVLAENNLEYLNFNSDSNLDTYKVSYYIVYSTEKQVTSFDLEIIHNGILVDNCKKTLVYDSKLVSEKIMCDVPKKFEGEYLFIAKLLNKEEVVETITTYEKIKKNNVYFFDEHNSTLEFQVNSDSTNIIITVNEKGENLVVLNQIPKEVIENLNDENKNEMIISNFKYEILDSDPLIAWSVDKAPTKINYTITKKISLEDQKNFSIDIQNDSFYNNLKWVVYILIFLIIVLALKSSFKKS